MRFVRQEKKNKNNTGGVAIKGPLDAKMGQKASFPEIDEYYLFTPKPSYPTGGVFDGGGKQSIKIAKDAITYVTSGLFDRNKGTCLSYMHKAIKALNQLRICLLYTSPSPRDRTRSRMPSSA